MFLLEFPCSYTIIKSPTVELLNVCDEKMSHKLRLSGLYVKSCTLLEPI